MSTIPPPVARRGVATPRLTAAIVVLVALVVGLATKDKGFTVVVAALAAYSGWDLARRLDRRRPPTPSSPADADADEESDEVAAPDEEVSRPVVAAGSAITCLLAGINIKGTNEIYLGFAIALVLIGLWAMVRSGRPGLMAAIGRSTIVVFLCGFGGGHAVLLRRQAGGLKLAVVLVVAVAAYELSATVFEAALVQIRPSQNRQAPLAGTVLCAIWGLIAGTVFNPPVTVGGGFVIGVAAALAAAVGRALPALFDVEHGDGGLEIAAVAASLFVAAPVVYYVARVVL